MRKPVMHLGLARRLAAFALLAAIATAMADATAQGRPKAVLTARTAEPVTAGGTATLTLDVKLPANIHVQSDEPRDPSLIPTALTVTPPAGVTVKAIRYPKAVDFPQPGRGEPLAVFGPVFAIELDASVAADVPAGVLAIPARLRYQACDEQTCFAPARDDVSWSIEVRAAKKSATRSR